MRSSNLRLGVRLGLSFAGLLVMASAVVTIGISRMAGLTQSLTLISADRVPKVQKLAEVTDDVNLIARELRNTLIFDDEVRVHNALEIAAGARDRIAAVFAELAPTIESEEGKVQLQATTAARKAYVPAQARFMELIREHRHAEAEALLVQTMRRAQLDYMSALDDFKNFQVKLISDAAETGRRDYENGVTLMSALLLGMAVVGAGLGWHMTRSVTIPIGQAVEVAERVAAGDLTSTIKVSHEDETGRLLSALQAMNTGLSKIVSTVRSSSQSIASDSLQIASGNRELSTRTEAQSRSLQQTAASVKELDLTVKQNAASARQANELAQGASLVATRGGEVFRQVVDTMQGISSSSRQIAEITNVIDGIAFQTNILALNAAVEAARAGDHGRGFALVASEVGTLAKRSAEAAEEIKSLIEASGDCVTRGTALVGHAGSTMDEIVIAIGDVTRIVSEISSASESQTLGVGQVGSAMTEIDKVTKDNADLVQQSAGAAGTLSREARDLVNAVELFKVRPDSGERPAGALSRSAAPPS